MSKVVLIGIAGGTGSGKTTVAKKIMKEFDPVNVIMIEHDSYYKDQSNLDLAERNKTNYDHPFAFDTDLLIEQLNSLMSGKAIEKPIYDFCVHNRAEGTELIEPCGVIIVEGILILEDERLRDMLDIKVYVDTDDDVRFIRRLLRDVEERGRTMESIVNQYLDVVRPMYQQFIEPTKRFADLIIPEGGHNQVAIDILVTKVKSIIKGLD